VRLPDRACGQQQPLDGQPLQDRQFIGIQPGDGAEFALELEMATDQRPDMLACRHRAVSHCQAMPPP